jgi:hypothetical protein
VLAVLFVTLATLPSLSSARVTKPVVLSTQRRALPGPHLIVQGWLDRNYVSDLYAFDLVGRPLRRLTGEPLPACAAVIVE